MAQEYSSGTVSKILWHFTGGPNWNYEKKQQSNEIKSFDDAFSNLKSIVNHKELRLSRYQEIIKVQTKIFTFSKDKRKRIPRGYIDREMEASPVCCLADIPIQHLNYHAIRYGKFAIGYHRNSVLKNHFNPVFYSLSDTKVVNSIYSGISEASFLDLKELEWNLEILYSELEHTAYYDNKEKIYDLDDKKLEIEGEIKHIKESIRTIEKSLQNFIAFIKTFNADQFHTIYCEREWRSIETFKFKLKDIAMIVLPKHGGYYNKFIRENLAPGIPVVPWEDLIES